MTVKKKEVDLYRQKLKPKILKHSSEIKFSSLKLMKASIRSRQCMTGIDSCRNRSNFRKYYKYDFISNFKALSLVY